MTNEELTQYIIDNRQNIIDDLEGFIAIPSVSDNIEEVDRALDYAMELGEKLGFRSKTVCDHQIGIIEAGEGEETVGILAHVDVVPPGDLEDWETDPFKMEIRDGRVIGRGTMDDKGPAVVSLYAMKALLDSGEPMHKKIQMILGTQEEVEWTDMDAFMTSDPELPDYGFTPDGEFPLCNIEKGIVDGDMIFNVDESRHEDGWYVTDLQAGIMDNAIPGKAKATLEHFVGGISTDKKNLEASGKAVHSSQPEKGDNALFRLADMVEQEHPVRNDLYSILIMLRDRFSSIFGKELGLYSPGETYQGEYVHRNAFSATLTKMEGSRLSVHINCRFAYGTESDEIVQVLSELAVQYGGTFENVEPLPAVFVSSVRPFIKEFNDAYREGSGREPDCVLAYGGSYAKAMPNIVSWGPIFPGDEDKCHEDNEYITMDTLLDNGKVFALALYKVVMSEKSFK